MHSALNAKCKVDKRAEKLKNSECEQIMAQQLPHLILEAAIGGSESKEQVNQGRKKLLLTTCTYHLKSFCLIKVLLAAENTNLMELVLCRSNKHVAQNHGASGAHSDIVRQMQLRALVLLQTAQHFECRHMHALRKKASALAWKPTDEAQLKFFGINFKLLR